MLAAPVRDSGVVPVHHGVVVPARAADSHCASVGTVSPSWRVSCMHAFQSTDSTGFSSEWTSFGLDSVFHSLGFRPAHLLNVPWVTSYFEMKYYGSISLKG